MKKKSPENTLIYPLKWNINFDFNEIFEDIKKIGQILKDLIREYQDEKERRFYRNLENWNNLIERILESIRNIQECSILVIEKRLDIKFKDHNLFVIALFTRTTKNLFLEMNQAGILRYKYPNIFSIQILERLINLGELAEGLATLGDAVLGLVAVHRAWEKGLFKKGNITSEKNELEENSKLAQICDDLKLDEYKISVVPESKNILQKTINHKKATLLEAIIWIYYSENGFEKVLSLFKKI